MAVSADAVRAEGIMWDYEIDLMPEGLTVVERDDLLMWKRPRAPAAQLRWSNRVSWVRTTAANVERTIGEVFDFFRALPFTWVVGPSTRPTDLGAHLSARGLRDTGDGDLLSAELPIDGLRTCAGLRIVEVEDEVTARVGLRLAHPGAGDAEIEWMLRDRLAYLRDPRCRGGNLVAFLDGEPVANAGYRYSSDGATVYLTGAETVERHRGRGIYQSLVGYRAAHAFDRGCRYAAIRARRETSLPILLGRGFVNHGHLPIFERRD